MDEFIASFISEAQELLSRLESDLIQLEKQPSDPEITGDIFRIMHNLKGAARMFGFEEIQNLAHEFENIFDLIRTDKLKVTSDLIDDILKGRDMLLSMLSKEVPPEISQEFILQVASRYSAQEYPETSVQTNNPGSLTRPHSYCILFRPDQGIFERGLNPEGAIDEILEKGRAKIILHEGASSWEKQKQEKQCFAAWEIYFHTSLELKELEEIFLFYDSDEYKLLEFNHYQLENETETHDFFKEYYGTTLTVAEHVKQCLENLNNEFNVPSAGSQAIVPVEKEIIQQSIGSQHSKESTINVSSGKLDELLNLVSELVISTAALDSHATRLQDPKLISHIENIEKLTKKFRNNALALRLIPVSTLLNKLNRQVRDLCASLNKDVTLILEGQETEIDKTVLKAIESPLIHIVRNSLDHGIELPHERVNKGKSAQGMLKIIAFYSGANVIIQVHDDGKGIDLERVKECAIIKGYISPEQNVTTQELLNLIMEPGFTTNEYVSMVSGRGVGMDVVRKELNQIGGSLEIETEKGLGTSISLKLPTTLSIIDTLMLEVNKMHVLVPMLEVEYCYREDTANLYSIDSNYLNYKNKLVPFISLRQKFKAPPSGKACEMVIIINKFDKKYAIIADDIIGEQQAVIKPLGELFVNQPYFSGGSFLVDGNLALVLDTSYLFTQSVVN
jgi:two-component system, chemotaxis family, sensor kinase CheA